MGIACRSRCGEPAVTGTTGRFGHPNRPVTDQPSRWGVGHTPNRPVWSPPDRPVWSPPRPAGSVTPQPAGSVTLQPAGSVNPPTGRFGQPPNRPVRSVTGRLRCDRTGRLRVVARPVGLPNRLRRTGFAVGCWGVDRQSVSAGKGANCLPQLPMTTIHFLCGHRTIL